MSFTCHTHGWRHAQNCCPICHPELKPKQEDITDVTAQDLVKGMSAFDMPTEEELLFYATPHYEELQRKKELRAQQLKDQPDGQSP